MPDNQVSSPVLYLYEQQNKDSRTILWPKYLGKEGSIQENRSYIFELTGVTKPDDVEFLIDDFPLEALRSKNNNTARWLWSPGFYAGSIKALLIFPDGEKKEFEIITDPALNKLTRSDFNTMVEQILEDTLALFSLSSFRTGIARGSGNTPPPIARLEYIKSRIDEIINTVQKINERPVRILKGSIKNIPAHRAKSITGQELLNSLRGGQLTRIQNQNAIKRFPEELKGHYPKQIKKQIRSDGLNIKEHQEIKAALRSWSVLLEIYSSLLNSLLDKRPKRNTEEFNQISNWANRCINLSTKLKRLTTLPLFREVTDRNGLPEASSIYRRVPAYRNFFQLHQDMILGISNVFGDFLQLPLARTYDLYELWCFLRLLRALVNIYPTISFDSLFTEYSPESGQLTLPSGNVEIELPDGKLIAFQRTYKEFWKNDSKTGSFSRSMKPDISLEFNKMTGPEILVLDAKYRIKSQLNDAISSIHMYRDAIVQAGSKNPDKTERIVSAAYLLSPYLPDITENKNWNEENMPGRLFNRNYRGLFKFGAATLRPGMSIGEISSIFRDIIEDSNLSTMFSKAK